MNMFEDSVTYQFIGNVAKGGDGNPSDILDLPEGAVAILQEDGSVYTGATTGARSVEDGVNGNDRMRIAQKVNGQLVFSPYFVVNDSRVEEMPYSEEVPQITYLGFNGTEGELDDEEGATYTLGVVLQHTQGVLNNTPMIKTIPAYLDDEDQSLLAVTLKDAFNRVMDKENRKSIVCQRVVNGADLSVAAAGTVHCMRVTNGSTNVEFFSMDGVAGTNAANITTSADAAVKIPYWGGREFEFDVLHTADHLVYIGPYHLESVDAGTSTSERATGIAAAINDNCNGDVIASANGDTVTVNYMPHFKALPPMVWSAESTQTNIAVDTEVGTDFRVAYRIEDVTSENNADLDRPWEGPSGFVSIETQANVNQASRVATVSDEDWGLVFVGQTPDPTAFRTVTETYHPVTFKLSWERIDAPADADPDLTDITYDVAAQPSRSSFFEVAAREIYATMNEGNSQVGAYPPTNYRHAANPRLKYNTFIINATDSQYVSPTTGQRPVSKYNIYVALNDQLGDDYDEFDELT